MTAREYIDDVKLRLLRNDVMTDLDDSLILTCINRARRKVQHVTMTLTPERYGNKVEILPAITTSEGMRRYILPVDCIDVYVAYFEYNEEAGGDTTIVEMRRVTNREIETVRDHSFNGPTLHFPIFTVYYGIGGTMTRDVLDMTYGNATLSGDIEQIIVYYIAAIDDLETLSLSSQDDDEEVIPAEFDELVVLYGVLYCLQIIQEEIAKRSIEAEIDFIEKGLKGEYEKEKIRTSIMLPSKEGI